MKNYESPFAVCPFYKHETGSTVTCEGTGCGSEIKLTFPHCGAMRHYTEVFCCGHYEDCVIARALFYKYGVE